MNHELLAFFAKGLIIMFLLVLGLFLLGRMRKILASLFFGWLMLVLIVGLVAPLILVIYGLVCLVKK